MRNTQKYINTYIYIYPRATPGERGKLGGSSLTKGCVSSSGQPKRRLGSFCSRPCKKEPLPRRETQRSVGSKFGGCVKRTAQKHGRWLAIFLGVANDLAGERTAQNQDLFFGLVSNLAGKRTAKKQIYFLGLVSRKQRGDPKKQKNEQGELSLGKRL